MKNRRRRRMSMNASAEEKKEEKNQQPGIHLTIFCIWMHFYSVENLPMEYRVWISNERCLMFKSMLFLYNSEHISTRNKNDISRKNGSRRNNFVV